MPLAQDPAASCCGAAPSPRTAALTTTVAAAAHRRCNRAEPRVAAVAAIEPNATDAVATGAAGTYRDRVGLSGRDGHDCADIASRATSAAAPTAKAAAVTPAAAPTPYLDQNVGNASGCNETP